MPPTLACAKPYFIPTDVGGCRLWLDAADANSVQAPGGTVSQWNDKSTLGNNTTGTGTITYSGSAVSTNGSSYFSVPVDSRRTTVPNLQVFIVYTWTGYSTTGNFGLWGDDQGGGWNRLQLLNFTASPASSYGLSKGATGANTVTVSAMNTTNRIIYHASYNGLGTNACFAYVNGIEQANFTDTSASSQTSITTTFFSGISANNLPTAIAFNEIIMYNTAISTPERNNIEGYLAQKWGLTVNLPPGHPGLRFTYYKTNSTLTYGIPSLTKLNSAFAYTNTYSVVGGPGGSFQFTTTPTQYLSIPNSTAFTQNTAFTYELWYYPTSTNIGYLVAMLQPNWITVKWNTGTAGTIGLDMSYVGNAPGYVPQNRIYAINRWHHIALSWNGTNGVLYMNGVSECTFTGAGGLVNAGNPLLIGQYQGQGQPTPLGYFTNIRFVKGVAVYTGAFTPPTTPLTVTQNAGTNISAITAGQTQLLISATSSATLLTDSSTNNFTITNNGSVAWNALTPF